MPLHHPARANGEGTRSFHRCKGGRRRARNSAAENLSWLARGALRAPVPLVLRPALRLRCTGLCLRHGPTPKTLGKLVFCNIYILQPHFIALGGPRLSVWAHSTGAVLAVSTMAPAEGLTLLVADNKTGYFGACLMLQ